LVQLALDLFSNPQVLNQRYSALARLPRVTLGLAPLPTDPLFPATDTPAAVIENSSKPPVRATTLVCVTVTVSTLVSSVVITE
jgi:hypothetical protein